MTARSADLLAVLAGARVTAPLPDAFGALAVDSRATTPGALFVAVRGERVDGHDFATAAVDRGAAALVVERELPLAVPQVVVGDTQRAISRLADAFYARPSAALRVAGITGTNGKTTTTHFVRAICSAAGLRCGIIGTLGASFESHEWALENTTPLALDLQRILAAMRDAGAGLVAIEVSSHALALARADDVTFTVAALTNITRDHLDFHGTQERYVAAKRRLFDLAPHAVLNLDDPAGAAFAAELSSVTTYAIERDAEWRATGLDLRGDGSSFSAGGLALRIALPGRFNVANALAAAGIARRLGVADAAIAAGLAALDAVPGRMERIGGGGIDALVDYAHSPDALANVLRAAREATRGRVIVVFGCGGERDQGKRAPMGRIAAELADVVFVTSDNPRGEDPAAIARAVAGTTGATVILDRRAAIRSALAAAVPGDTVVVAGKGHERYQLVAGERLPFDDRDEVRAALEAAST